MPRAEAPERPAGPWVRSGRDRARFGFDAIGTRWVITTEEPLDATARASVLARIERFDADWSRFRDDSLVSRIARAAGRYELPADAVPLLDLYRRLGDATDGRVNPLVGRRLEHLGYDASYSLRASADPVGVPAWRDVVRVDGTTLTTSAPALIDVGAAGKGHLVDIVGDVLADLGVSASVVDASGDIRHRGSVPARVALEHPDDASLAIGVVELADAALCASAVNRRSWGDGLHHVLDGTTGHPTRDVVATWAIAPTALEADGIATALFFAGADELRRRGVGVAFEALRIRSPRDGRPVVEATPVFERALHR